MSKHLEKNILAWHKKNGWFDGTSNRSKIALNIQWQLKKEGYKLNTVKLLKELDRRLELQFKELDKKSMLLKKFMEKNDIHSYSNVIIQNEIYDLFVTHHVNKERI